MDNTHELPGVTFYLSSARLEKTNVVGVTLTATVHDRDVWEAVLEKLKKGHRVYTVDNLEVAYLRVLETDLKEERAKYVRDTSRLTNENEHLKQRLSLLEAAMSAQTVALQFSGGQTVNSPHGSPRCDDQAHRRAVGLPEGGRVPGHGSYRNSDGHKP